MSISMSISLRRVLFCSKWARSLCSIQKSENEPSYPIPNKKPIWTSASEAMTQIKSGDSIFVHGFAATPTALLIALCNQVKTGNLKDIVLHHFIVQGEIPWIDDEYNGLIRSNSLFTGPNLRKTIAEGRADFNSILLSETALLFRKNYINLDVTLIHTSIPDSKGFCSLGTSVDCTRAAVINSKHVIGILQI